MSIKIHIKLILVLALLIMSISCKKEKVNRQSKEINLQVESVNYHKVVKWLSSRLTYITMTVKITNLTDNEFIVKREVLLDSLNLNLHFNDSIKVFETKNFNLQKVDSLKPNDSITLDFIVKHINYDKNLKLLIDNNNYLNTNNTFLSYNATPKNINKIIDTVFLNNKLVLNLFLDNEKISLDDSIKLNYSAKVLHPEEFEKVSDKIDSIGKLWKK